MWPSVNSVSIMIAPLGDLWSFLFECLPSFYRSKSSRSYKEQRPLRERRGEKRKSASVWSSSKNWLPFLPSALLLTFLQRAQKKRAKVAKLWNAILLLSSKWKLIEEKKSSVKKRLFWQKQNHGKQNIGETFPHVTILESYFSRLSQKLYSL